MSGKKVVFIHMKRSVVDVLNTATYIHTPQHNCKNKSNKVQSYIIICSFSLFFLSNPKMSWQKTMFIVLANQKVFINGKSSSLSFRIKKVFY